MAKAEIRITGGWGRGKKAGRGRGRGHRAYGERGVVYV
jgi:hypothetical protein